MFSIFRLILENTAVPTIQLKSPDADEILLRSPPTPRPAAAKRERKRIVEAAVSSASLDRPTADDEPMTSVEPPTLPSQPDMPDNVNDMPEKLEPIPEKKDKSKFTFSFIK